MCALEFGHEEAVILLLGAAAPAYTQRMSSGNASMAMAPSVAVTGAVAVYKELINGVYDPTHETSYSTPVYKKRADADIYLKLMLPTFHSPFSRHQPMPGWCVIQGSKSSPLISHTQLGSKPCHSPHESKGPWVESEGSLQTPPQSIKITKLPYPLLLAAAMKGMMRVCEYLLAEGEEDIEVEDEVSLSRS